MKIPREALDEPLYPASPPDRTSHSAIAGYRGAASPGAPGAVHYFRAAAADPDRRDQAGRARSAGPGAVSAGRPVSGLALSGCQLSSYDNISAAALPGRTVSGAD